MSHPISVYGYDSSMLAAAHAAFPQSASNGGLQLHRPNPGDVAEPTTVSSSGCNSCEPSFPLMSLPVEIISQILCYILPKTIPYKSAFSSSTGDPSDARWDVVWQRGNINILIACRFLHDEGRRLLYGNSTFQLQIHYDRIEFGFVWILPRRTSYDYHGCLTPRQNFDFISKFSPQSRALMRRFVLNIREPDGYFGWIHYNISNTTKLATGLREHLLEIRKSLDMTTCSSAISSILDSQSQNAVHRGAFFGVNFMKGPAKHNPYNAKKELPIREWVIQPLRETGAELMLAEDAWNKYKHKAYQKNELTEQQNIDNLSRMKLGGL